MRKIVDVNFHGLKELKLSICLDMVDYNKIGSNGVKLLIKANFPNLY